MIFYKLSENDVCDVILSQYILALNKLKDKGGRFSSAKGRIIGKNLVHFRKNLKHKSYRKIQKSCKNPKNL